MAPPGSYPIKRLALFNLTSQPISNTWLEYIQQQGNKDNDDNTIIEVIPAGVQFTRLDMARYSHQHFLSSESPFASRCFLAADEKSVDTNTVIIINLIKTFLEYSLDHKRQEEKDVIE